MNLTITKKSLGFYVCLASCLSYPVCSIGNDAANLSNVLQFQSIMRSTLVVSDTALIPTAPLTAITPAFQSSQALALRQKSDRFLSSVTIERKMRSAKNSQPFAFR